MENKIVAKKNVLVPEFVKLGHQEKRLLAYCISQLDPLREKEFNRFTVRVSEITKIFGLPEKSAYSRLREAATTINSRPILTKEGQKHWMDWWFSWLHWEEGSGVIEVQFNERLIPFLLDLKKEYMQYPLSMVAGFSSNQTWTVYEILKQWLPIRKKHFSLDEFKDLLGLVGKYPQWFNLKRFVINPAIKEINEKSDIEVSYIPEKQKRRITGLVFHIDKKQPDNVITVESALDKLYKALISQGINHKTALEYAQKTESKKRTKSILKKLPEIVRRAEKTAMSTTAEKNKSTVIKYILGAIKKELNQGQLFEFEPNEPVYKYVTREQVVERKWPIPGESWERCIARLRLSNIIVR